MERSNARIGVGLVLALIGGYLLSVSASPARGLPDALLALVVGAALGLATLFLLMRDYVPGVYSPSRDELAYQPWRPIHFLTCAVKAAPLYVGIRLFLFLAWYQPFSSKRANPAWHSGEALNTYWVRAVTPGPTGATPTTFVQYRAFLQWLIDTDAASWMTYVVMGGELAIALGLLLGCLTGWAAFFGLLMNLSFLLAGTTSTNPLLVILQILCMFGYSVAGYWGLDRWLLPAIGTPWNRTGSREVVPTSHRAAA